jgi:hypothetical protein
VVAARSRKGELTAQGHPRTIFKRAIEKESLVIAEATARELGRLTLAEALELTALIARKEPSRHPRVAARWLKRYLEDQPAATIGEGGFAATLLGALGTAAHDEALSALRAMAERATSGPPRRSLA